MNEAARTTVVSNIFRAVICTIGGGLAICRSRTLRAQALLTKTTEFSMVDTATLMMPTS